MDLWVLLSCQVAIGQAQDKAGRGIEEQTALAVYLCVSPNDLLYHLFACVCLQRVLDSLELELLLAVSLGMEPESSPRALSSLNC